MIHPVDDEIGQDFGANPTRNNPHPIFGDYQPDGHSGRDYKCWSGTPVRAVTSGTVLHVGWFGGTYADNPWWIMPSFAGYTYVVDHGSFIGIYGHCQDGGAKVRVGQHVSEGQALGPSGNTGASTGDHLHFEALPDGYILNSYMYGRINPASLFAGALTPQSGTTITPIPATKELFTMGQYEDLTNLVKSALSEATNAKVAANKARDIAAENQRRIGALPDNVWKETVLRGGRNISVKQELADAKTEAQALRAAVAGLVASGSTSLTADQITAAVKAGIADGTVTVDVNVNGGSNV